MKYKALDFLVCPLCKAELKLVVYKTANDQRDLKSSRYCKHRCAYKERKITGKPNPDARTCKVCLSIEIQEGAMACSCGAGYPVINGIPRFLFGDLQKALAGFHKDFFARYGADFSSPGAPGDGRCDKLVTYKEQTMDRFGYEWTNFKQYNSSNFLRLIEPVKEDFFYRKMGLDVGCGAGRHMRQSAAYGAEMVGVDISWAVESAGENSRDAAGILHVIQADIFQLPFREKYFDFIYSLGVLHHTTDPPQSFAALVPHLADNGAIIIWVYANKRRFLLFALSLARNIAKHLSNDALKRVSFLAASIDYGVFILPYKLLFRMENIRPLVDKITPPRIKGYAKHNFHVSYTDWFDRLSCPLINYYDEEDVRSWYRRSGLKQIITSPTGLNGWRGFGIRK